MIFKLVWCLNWNMIKKGKNIDHFWNAIVSFLNKIWDKIGSIRIIYHIPVGFIPGYEDFSVLANSVQSAIWPWVKIDTKTHKTQYISHNTSFTSL